MTSTGRFSQRIKIAIILGVITLLSAGSWMLHKEPPPSLPIVTTDLSSIPFPKPSLLDRCIPANWGWLWRLKSAVLGSPKTITINCWLMRCINAPGLPFNSILENSSAHVSTNGVQVWILNENEVSKLHHDFEESGAELISSPRVMTADGVQSQLRSGNSISSSRGPAFAGFILTTLARVHRDDTDLIAMACNTAAITNQASMTTSARGNSLSISAKTNLSVAVRVQLPRQGGAFLLSPNRTNAGGGPIGLLISADVHSHKR